jgi:hypothetical protein
MNRHEIARGLETIASEAVPADADVWPQLRARVDTKKVRRNAPRRRAGALLAAAVVVLAITMATLTPVGANAATGALGLFGLQPIGAAPVAPRCVGAVGTTDPIYTPVEPGTFTVAGGSAAPAAGQAVQISCPEGYQLEFAAGSGEANGVLTFLGVTTIGSAMAAPSCVGADGRVAPTQSSVSPVPFTIAALAGVPLPAMTTEGMWESDVSPATQISCPEGYELTIDEQ